MEQDWAKQKQSFLNLPFLYGAVLLLTDCMVLEVTFSGQKLGSKGKRQWVTGPFQVFLFKTTFCSSWEFASMCHILCSVRPSSAEGLVTWWVLVWGCVETEELCIAVSSAGQGFLKQMVTTLEQPAGLCLAGTCSFWLCRWLLASAFPSGVRGSDMPSITYFCSTAYGIRFYLTEEEIGHEEDILLLRWEDSERKREDHKHLALSGYMVEHASCTVPIPWAQSTADVPSHLLKIVAWCFGHFFPCFPRISWALTNAAICKFVIVNLLGSSCSLM